MTARSDPPGDVPERPGEPEPEAPDVTVDMGLDALRTGPGLRVAGLDREHVLRLVDVIDQVPPIVVDRVSRAVVDGYHRVEAARLAGRRVIRARLLAGSELDLLVAALDANGSHGLPLTRTDRRLAADRLLRLNPDFSDRRVAVLVGVSPGMIARLRSSTAPSGRLNTDDEQTEVIDQPGPERRPPDHRLGRDGRLRPTSAAPGKDRARELFAERPQATLREVALAAGISVGTAHRVRTDLLRDSMRTAPLPSTRPADLIRDVVENPARCLARLQRDPALSRSESGREVLTRLRALVLTPGDGTRFVGGIPEHQIEEAARLVRQAARQWVLIADHLESRRDRDGAPVAPCPAPPGPSPLETRAIS